MNLVQKNSSLRSEFFIGGGEGEFVLPLGGRFVLPLGGWFAFPLGGCLR